MATDERKVRAIGEDLFARMRGEKPGLFDKAWWSGQILEWAMRDEAFKTEMFRFVDVFPVLTTPDEVARHIQEYLLRPGLEAPAVIKMALKGAGLGSIATRMATGQIAKNLEGMAKRFIAGTDAASAVAALRELRQQKQAFTVDLLGEAVVSEPEAEAFAARYVDLIDGLARECAGWSPDERLDRDDQGPIPRVNVSVKASAMYSQFDPLPFDRTVEAAARRLLPIFRRARERGVFLNVDMEQHAYKDLTLALFRRVLEDPSLEGWEHAGIAMQAYHRDCEADVRELVKWAKKARRRVTVRLVKGAYWDYETVRAAQEGWRCPVWLDKADSDVTYERCAELLLDNHKHVRTALGSHNVRSLAFALATAEKMGIPQSGYEIQCLYGMAEPIKAACVARGHRVRVYAPIGQLLPGMAYLVRRLLENTSNQSWLRLGFVEGKGQEELLAPPRPVNRDPYLRPRPPAETPADRPPPFANEPLRDFTDPARREAFTAAVRNVERVLGRTYAPIIDGKPVQTGRTMERLDPNDGRTRVGTFHLAGVAEADRAVAGARAAFPAWRDPPVRDRAGLLFRVAARLRARRDELSALMVREVGKPWRMCDGDVAEAIDFCEFYGREMLRLSEPRLTQHVPGETNHLVYQGRGVSVVIAPWNFPVAILTGMAAAALAAGNTVVMKPAEQSTVLAAWLMEIFQQAGAPPGVLQFVPGVGEEIGPRLVSHPDVSTVAFTGSLQVGLQIWRDAAATAPGQALLRRVVCEMGGKNAIVVDGDADLDEAVLGVLHSAFGYAGQKCSACSRAIVVADHYDAFVQRLVEATRSLVVAPATDPGSSVGPVIDADAHQRILRTIADARARGLRLVLGGEHPGPGWFVPPTIFADVPPDDPIAQEEIFGPVLAVIRARHLDEALEIANGTRYALTGGVFSRSPANIAKAKEKFRVGNLYVNRGITGAMVQRQPFGGFGMSGGGTKAGGPDYLLHFLDARVVTENTQRRGFAPSSPEDN